MQPEKAFDSKQLKERFQNCKTIEEVKRRIREGVDWDGVSVDPDIVVEALSCPEITMKWPRVIAKGKACVAEVRIASAQFHSQLPLRVRLTPPQRLSAGFNFRDYQRSECTKRPGQLDVKMKKEDGLGTWSARLPFEVPDNPEILSGDHHWTMQLDFLDFVGMGPACFEFEVTTKIAEKDFQRTLIVEGAGVVRIRKDEFTLIHTIGSPIIGEPIVDVGSLGGDEEKDNADNYVSVQVRVNRSATGEDARFPVFSKHPLAQLAGDSCGQLIPTGRGVPIVLHACSVGERPSLLLGRFHKTHGADMLFPIKENTISRRNTRLEILPDGLSVRSHRGESPSGSKRLSVGRTVVNGELLGQDAKLLRSGLYSLGLGGSKKNGIPEYPVKMCVIRRWDDCTTNGIPASTELFRFITATPRKGARQENNELIDAVILEYLKPPDCSETATIHVMLARQLFLDPEGRPVDAEEDRRTRAVRLFCCSDLQKGMGANLFMIQRLRAELTVDDQPIDRLAIVPLQEGMRIRIGADQVAPKFEFTWARAPEENPDPARPSCFVDQLIDGQGDFSHLQGTADSLEHR